MPLHCGLELENPRGFYYAGETIIGRVTLNLPERGLMRALGLEVSGYAATSWIKPPKKKKEKQKKSKTNPQLIIIETKPAMTFENRMDYLSTINYFIGSEGATEKIIDSGVYQYDFSVRLPDQCPSSFEGEHGHIRYTLQVFMCTTHAKQRHILYSRTLAVERLRDLREQTCVLANARDLQQQERISRTKFWRRPLQLELNIPREGYAPGESISVHVRIHNPQHLKLTELIYKLNLLTTHLGMHKQKRHESKLERRNLITSVHKLNNLSAESKASLVQHLQTLEVPITPPTLTVAECQCLQLEYEIEVLVFTTQAKRTVQAQLPITIGSISLTSKEPKYIPSQIVNRSGALAASVASLSVARSMDDLNMLGIMATGTAPPQSPTSQINNLSHLSVSMCSLATNFREAEFMKVTNPNKTDKHAMSGQKDNYRPRYLYYEMESEESEKML